MSLNPWMLGSFLALVSVTAFSLPQRYRWTWLLGVSGVLYAWFDTAALGFVLAITYASYLLGIAIQRAQGPARRRRLAMTLAITLAPLVLFKLREAGGFAGGGPAGPGEGEGLAGSFMSMPLGLSFLTFSLVAYAVDVYRRTQAAERNFGAFLLFVLFFPKIVAGPIERAQRFLPQVRAGLGFDDSRVVSGLRLVVWGLLRKIVIADTLATFVDAVYASPRAYSGFALTLATYLYAVQIYCDFAGYTDIARGMARVLGFRLACNFRQPYLAGSLPEFWRRWHITLMNWFREYVWWYLVRGVPLGDSLVNRARRAGSLLAVFLLSGLWHGTAWTFVVWGAIHGFLMVAAGPTGVAWSKVSAATGLDRAPRLRQGVGIFLTFNLVTLTWIVFRASSLGDAWYIVTHLLSDFRITLRYGIGLGLERAAIIGACFVLMEAVEWAHRAGRLKLAALPGGLRWSLYAAAVLMVLFMGRLDSSAKFVYCRF